MTRFQIEAALRTLHEGWEDWFRENPRGSLRELADMLGRIHQSMQNDPVEWNQIRDERVLIQRLIEVCGPAFPASGDVHSFN